jgi:hypothetical protein
MSDEYPLFASEDREYNLGHIGFEDRPLGQEIARKFLSGFRGATKTAESVAFLVQHCSETYRAKDCSEDTLEYGVRFGNLALETELLSMTRSGDLIAVTIDTDERDEILPRSEWQHFFPLASFQEEQGDIIFRTHKIHQMGINPTFLYALGEKYEKKEEERPNPKLSPF